MVHLRWLPQDFSDIVTEMGNIIQFTGSARDGRLVGVKKKKKKEKHMSDCAPEPPRAVLLLKGGVAIKTQLLALSSVCRLLVEKLIVAACAGILLGNWITLQSHRRFIIQAEWKSSGVQLKSQPIVSGQHLQYE